MKKKETQPDKVLQYIKDFGSINIIEAIRDLGITRLSASIYQLKKKGYKIVDEYQSTYNRYGDKTSFKRYYIERSNDMKNVERQKSLDKQKWLESEVNGYDMSGEMPYCWHCPKCILGIDEYNTCTVTQEQRETECLCAKAFNRMKRAK